MSGCCGTDAATPTNSAEKSVLLKTETAKASYRTVGDNGPKYVNVAEGFLVNFIYSKTSLCFLSVVALLTACNTFIFTRQISESNLLCRVNDYLPLGKDLRRICMPVVYYCRFLELSVPTNALQLALCVLALICAINRRSTLFLMCYSFLCLTLLLSAVFFMGLWVLDYEHLIEPSVSEMLDYVLHNDSSFCDVLEPILDCKIPDGNHTDLIELACERPRRYVHLADDCIEHLTSFLLSRAWMFVLMMEYNALIVVGTVLSIRTVIRKRLKEHRRKLETAKAGN